MTNVRIKRPDVRKRVNKKRGEGMGRVVHGRLCVIGYMNVLWGRM